MKNFGFRKWIVFDGGVSTKRTVQTLTDLTIKLFLETKNGYGSFDAREILIYYRFFTKLLRST